MVNCSAKARSHCVFFFSDCDCNLVYRNKWVVQDSMEVFTLCDCDNITNSYVAHSEQKTNRSRNHKKSYSVNEPLERTSRVMRCSLLVPNTVFSYIRIFHQCIWKLFYLQTSQNLVNLRQGAKKWKNRKPI